MGTERKPIRNFEGRVRDITRRINQQERAPRVYHAQDLLGPGFGPTATQILDWSADEATFNGFFWSPVGAIHSPDPDEEWVGIVVAEDDQLYGVQTVWTARTGDPPRRYVRRWSDPGTGEIRTYTEWRGDSGWQTTGITPLNSSTIVTQAWRSDGARVQLMLSLDAGVLISSPSDGDIANTPIAQVPAALIPVDSPLAQPLAMNAGGLLHGYYIASTGEINVSAALPGEDINPGDRLTCGGSYML